MQLMVEQERGNVEQLRQDWASSNSTKIQHELDTASKRLAKLEKQLEDFKQGKVRCSAFFFYLVAAADQNAIYKRPLWVFMDLSSYMEPAFFIGQIFQNIDSAKTADAEKCAKFYNNQCNRSKITQENFAPSNSFMKLWGFWAA